MALITRLARLFRADFHAVLDRIEEPEVILRQAVREMEEDLAQDEHRLKLLEHEREQLALREKELKHSQASLDEELDVCFTASKDDLARPLMKRKLEIQRTLQMLSRRLEALQTKVSLTRQRLDENHTRCESMRQKADLFSERDRDANPQGAWTVPDISVRDEDVEVALLREKQRRTGS